VPLAQQTNTPFAAAGGFVHAKTATRLVLQVSAEKVTTDANYELLVGWNRIGVAVDAEKATLLTVTLAWPRGAVLDFWGINAGRVNLPERILKQKPSVDDLSEPHLAPETFYLPHESAFVLEIDPDDSTPFSTDDGTEITVKKCSYCGRLLPLRPPKGRLSFHRHRAKRTGHQNECRSCKKWRINDTLNVRRTVDQLHESSVITRERKILLREPEILQRIKDRHGAGLKSQVWERFGRKCFKCKKPLALEEVQLDHTRPLAYLWPLDEHATCLCAKDNNLKKEKFPVDFYNEDELERLSAICGLPIDELRLRRLNEVELKRLIRDLPAVAMQMEPRTFAATARKVREVRSDVDLFAILKEQDPRVHEHFTRRLKERPPSVSDLEE
jgi:hypothetical protein